MCEEESGKKVARKLYHKKIYSKFIWEGICSHREIDAIYRHLCLHAA